MSKQVFYTGVAWKHHISQDFENSDIVGGGAASGGTIFLDYKEMVEYLKSDGRSWHAAKLNLVNVPIFFEFNCDYMATILVDWVSDEGFLPVDL